MHSIRVLIVLLLVLAASAARSPAMAAASQADVAAARAHYRKAMSEYTLRHFDAAMAAFEKAYALNPEPALLYNIAQCHRQMGRHDEALFFYRRYLEGAPKARNRADVEQRIRELDEVIRRDRGGTTSPPRIESPEPRKAAATPPRGAPTAIPVVREPEATTHATAAPTPDDAKRGRGLRIAGLSLGAVGLTAIAAGVGFGIKAKSQGDDVAAARRFDPDADSAGRRAQTVQWAFYGAGGAALAAGAVLYYLGLDAGESRVSVAPTVSPRGFGATLIGAF